MKREEPKVVGQLTEEIIDQKMNEAVESKLLKMADWNRAIRIQNTQNFFGYDKGVYSVKFDSKANIWYYILRPLGIKEPTIKTMNKIMDTGSKEHEYLFLASDTKFNHRQVLGRMIMKYEL